MKTEDKININAIEISIAGTKLKLTLQQIKELKEILNTAFPEKGTIYIPYPSTVVHRHEYEWPYVTKPYKDFDVTWKCDTAKIGDAYSGTICLAANESR